MSEIHNIFTVYDDDKSGSLDEEEFAHALGLCGELN
jgi:Ca2+-binding EF-hand superfamily protein